MLMKPEFVKHHHILPFLQKWVWLTKLGCERMSLLHLLEVS